MPPARYVEKLRHQFNRYVVASVLFFFFLFMILLLVYTYGYNTYLATQYNRILVESFVTACNDYTSFLLNAETQQLLLRRLRGGISDNYTSFYFNSFELSTSVSGELILSDGQGQQVYTTFPEEEMNTHVAYFDQIVQNNLDGAAQDEIYQTVYHALDDTSFYVFALPIYDDNSRQAGGITLYLEGLGWDQKMKELQFDGIITDCTGHVIAASNRTMVDMLNRFIPSGKQSYHHNGQDYWVATSSPATYGVWIYTFVSHNSTGGYYALALITLALPLAVLLITGRRFAQRIAELNTRSLTTLSQEITQIQNGDTAHRIKLDTGDEFEEIATHINHMLDHLHTLSTQNMELVQLNNLMERKQLEAQFNPHFLYNTLENIRYAIRLGDCGDAEQMILNLTGLLRYSISTSQAAVTLKDDLKHLYDYLQIIQYRFHSRFTYTVQISECCLDRACPRLLLQPIVENSIKYGLQQKKTLNVTILGWEENSCLYLEVTDNGPGIPPDRLERLRQTIHSPAGQNKHKGLQNTARRLKLQFGPASGLTLEQAAGGGTTVLLCIEPKEGLP